MKNLRNRVSKSTILLVAASAAFMFSGCNAEMGGDSAGSSSANAPVVNSTTVNNPTPTQTPTQVTPNKNDDNAVADVASMVTDAQRQEYLDAINAARAETQDCGSEGVFDPAPALTWNNRLDNAAYEHSYDMAKSNTFSHTGSGTATDKTAKEENLGHGSNFRERIEHQGYTEFHAIGENIAAGYATAQEVVEAWLESDHHCSNMMNPKYTEVGMALVEETSGDYGFYWSQEFGAK